MSALLLPKTTRQAPGWTDFDSLPVRWKHPGPVAASAYDRGQGLPQRRDGQVLLLVNGKPAFRSKANRPGLWDLALLGAPAGVSEVRWSLPEMVEEVNDGLGSLAAAGVKLKQTCKTLGVSSGGVVWHVALPDRLVATRVTEWSAGSASHIVELPLPCSRQRMQAAHCE